MAKKLKIKQVRSLIHCNQNQRRTIAALGLKRINHTVELNDTPQIRGMVRKVVHLVEVVETKG
jgi:large subunit ribosomal protein L30